MSRSAPPDGTCLHLLKPAEISRPPRDVPLLAQTSSDHLSLAQMLSDSSAASRKHENNIKYFYSFRSERLRWSSQSRTPNHSGATPKHYFPSPSPLTDG